MAVMARDIWTDERLDDLNHRVDGGFNEMREEFRALRAEMQGEFREMRAEMAASRRTMVQAAAAIWVTSMVGFLGVIATILAST
jgi:hypothetical protein